MNGRSGDGTGSFEVQIKTNTAKFTNMIIARFRECRYLVRESEVFIKDKTKVASRVSKLVLILGSRCGKPIRRNSVLEELRVKTSKISSNFKN